MKKKIHCPYRYTRCDSCNYDDRDVEFRRLLSQSTEFCRKAENFYWEDKETDRLMGDKEDN